MLFIIIILIVINTIIISIIIIDTISIMTTLSSLPTDLSGMQQNLPANPLDPNLPR